MADEVLVTLKDSTTACNSQQKQPNYNGHDTVNYEQLLVSGQCADYSQFPNSDIRSITEADLKAAFDADTITGSRRVNLNNVGRTQISNYKSSAADVETVETNDYLTVIYNGNDTPSISTSCSGTLGPLSAQCSVPQIHRTLGCMLDSEDYTILITDELTSKNPKNVNSDTAAEIYLIPVDDSCNIRQDAHCDYLTPVKHARTLADYLDNDDNYLMAISDTSANCKSNAATEQAGGPSKSAANDNKNYLADIDDSTSRSAAYTAEDYLIPLDNSSQSSNNARSEYYLVAAADVTSHGYTYESHSGVGKLGNCCSRNISTAGEALTYTSLTEVHKQQQEQEAIESDYDNTADTTLDLSDYDNSAGLNVGASDVSRLNAN